MAPTALGMHFTWWDPIFVAQNILQHKYPLIQLFKVHNALYITKQTTFLWAVIAQIFTLAFIHLFTWRLIDALLMWQASKLVENMFSWIRNCTVAISRVFARIASLFLLKGVFSCSMLWYKSWNTSGTSLATVRLLLWNTHCRTQSSWCWPTYMT